VRIATKYLAVAIVMPMSCLLFCSLRAKSDEDVGCYVFTGSVSCADVWGGLPEQLCPVGTCDFAVGCDPWIYEKHGEDYASQWDRKRLANPNEGGYWMNGDYGYEVYCYDQGFCECRFAPWDPTLQATYCAEDPYNYSPFEVFPPDINDPCVNDGLEH